MDNVVVVSENKIKENLQIQLDEVEFLQSMFYNPGEFRIEDPYVLTTIKHFVNEDMPILPPHLDLIINLVIDDTKFELCVNLSNEYPDVEPEIFVRNHQFNRSQHINLNKDMNTFLAETERGVPCIFTAISWLQDNAHKYLDSKLEAVESKLIEKDDDLVRYWIYSHHIYSKSKRREIVDLAKTLNITGFCMPGKPGVICVEGFKTECDEWWQTIKSMNWKRIFCKLTEEDVNKSEKDFLKFETFEEIAFTNTGVKCNHMDKGEFHKYLEAHNLGYIFKELFGV